MQKAIIYFIIGTAASFLLHYFLLGSQGWSVDLLNAVAFGVAWGLAYYLDSETFTLPQKLGLSFIAMLALIGVGTVTLGLEEAVQAAIKFSMMFVAYYLIASMRASKTLRK